MGAAVDGGEVGRHKSARAGIFHGLDAGVAGNENFRMGIGIGRWNDANLAKSAFFVHFTGSAQLPSDVAHEPALHALVMGIGVLPQIALVVEGLFGPRLEHDVDLFLEDLAVMLVVGALVRHGRPAADLLAQHVGPARLVTARETDEAPPLGDVVEGRGLFGDANRVVNRHDVAQAADI